MVGKRVSLIFYEFIFGCVGSLAVRALAVLSRGSSPVAVPWLLLGSTGSRVLLGSYGSPALERRLSNCAARIWLL